MRGICLPHGLQPSTRYSSSAPTLSPASLHCSNKTVRYRNICLLSIAYACCLGLGPDLPWDDDRCPGILMLSVEWILTILFATHTGILTWNRSNAPFGTSSPQFQRSPTQGISCTQHLRFCTDPLRRFSPRYARTKYPQASIDALCMISPAATSVLYLSPGYFRRRASRPVSYYALFKWWLLLSQHPGCF